MLNIPKTFLEKVYYGEDLKAIRAYRKPRRHASWKKIYDGSKQGHVELLQPAESRHARRVASYLAAVINDKPEPQDCYLLDPITAWYMESAEIDLV